MKNLLIPTDFSDSSVSAFEFALTFTKGFRSKINLLHAYHVPVIDPNSPQSLLEDYQETQKQKAIENFKIFSHRHPNDSSSELLNSNEIEYHLEYGFGIDAIKKFVRSNDLDLVIMGTKGATGMEKILFGSTTSKAVKELDVPIIVVPKGYSYKPFTSVMMALDIKNFEMKDVEYILNFSRILNIPLNLIYFDNKNEEEVFNIVKEDSYQYFSEAFNENQITMERVSSNQTVLKQLDAYQKQHPASLLVLKKNPHSIWESMRSIDKVKSAVCGTLYPILVI